MPWAATPEFPETKLLRNFEFDPAAFEDLAWWIEHDRSQALRIVQLIRDVQRDPFKGIGKAEPLRRELKGCWSRRIDQMHRLVYQVQSEKIRILACRYHYDR
jgi:toxin YoeB